MDPVERKSIKKKKGKAFFFLKDKTDEAAVRYCQLVVYSRRSRVIHYGADVSRVLTQRGFRITPLDKSANI